MLKNKNNLILLLAIVVLAIAVYISFVGKSFSFRRTYYAVYLRTGDMYFGHLSRFPHLALTNVSYFQQTRNGKKVGLTIQKFEKAAFAPQDKLELNRSNVVWIAKLQPDSQVVKYIEGKLPPASPQPSPQASRPSANPSTNPSAQPSPVGK